MLRTLNHETRTVEAVATRDVRYHRPTWLATASTQRAIMKAYATLSRRSQLGRLRQLAQHALAAYGITQARLTLLRHETNTTFRVDTAGGPLVVRLNRPSVHTLPAIASEMAWLSALRHETNLGVPEPLAARDGSTVVLADVAGVPEPRACVLLRWLPGRFASAGLTPRHLARVAQLTAALQQHSTTWRPPAAFTRARVDTITEAARRGRTFSSAATAAAVEHPTQDDRDRTIALVRELVSANDGERCATALDIVRDATRALAAQPGTFGLIHADLHQENYLFHADAAQAIDFDDCGWGFYLYDLVVTLSELEEVPTYQLLRNTLLEQYSRLRPLPERYEQYLYAFRLLRKLQLLLWIVESREHAAFRDEWQAWARYDLDMLQTMLDAQPSVA